MTPIYNLFKNPNQSDELEIKNNYVNLERLEIYNLAAMSHVKISFEIPEYTCSVDGMGTLRILESIRNS